MCDMAHISGLVLTKEAGNPFDFCDIVTTTCHKSMRGPRAGMIFFKKVSVCCVHVDVIFYCLADIAVIRTSSWC
jgi:glycine/serine hydroxymethyltransferase